LEQVEGYFARHGGKTILIGRFIGLVRALAPFIAGTSKMRYSAFAPYSILGTGLWAATFILIGYFASQSLDRVAEIVSKGLIGFGFFVGFVVVVVATYRYLREPENRERVKEEMERRKWLRPVLALAQRLRPQARFLWGRLTPGNLGLELTTVASVLAVALFVLISYWSVVEGAPGPTPGDEAALDFANEIRMGWLDDLAEVVRALGSAYLIVPLAFAFALALGVMRRWPEVAVLVVGTAAILVLPDLIKDMTDRPRPPDPLSETSGSAFPSGHAAQATFYTWAAITVALRIAPGIAWRTALIVGGITVAALIGLAGVYLRVHWLSDVSAGWALGYAAFAAAAVVALIFSHIRDNLRRDDGPDDPARPAAGARH
jgi:undecaprenyl-diphosphatase